ncbi:hypothetical protein [Alteribacter populi]|uniref:hypothetical protein n=1 Tax=Alteribacter populi TaxID=2011011 RepID=UPI000BBA7DA2|nr:hypothetical protein [Alteribacter populi]
MRIYIYNNNFSEQSVRQMETIITFLECDKIFVDKKWENNLKDYSLVEYMDFQEFVNISGEKGIVYFNIIDGYHLKQYKNNNVKLIFRPRGIIPEESYYKNKNIFKKFVLNFIESKVMKYTDFFIFLSENQKKHYLMKYPKLQKNMDNSTILPNVKITSNNFSDLSRGDSKLKIVYSGGFSKWQNIDLVFKVVSKIIFENKACEFTVLTFDENFKKAKELADLYNITDNLCLKYVTPKGLDEELSYYDIGIIIRDNNIINVAASPFKIIDYISNGLAVIVTENIEDQIKKIINQDYFFSLNYRDGDITFSEEQLSNFVVSMTDGKNKLYILDNYKSYVSEIEKINLEGIFNIE